MQAAFSDASRTYPRIYPRIRAAPTRTDLHQLQLTNMSFPQLDYADYISGDRVRREAFAKAIAHSFEVYGFATVRTSQHFTATERAVF